MNNAEKEYRDTQAELSKLEKSEQELFKNMMKLTQEQKEELEVKVAELERSCSKNVLHISMKKKLQ